MWFKMLGRQIRPQFLLLLTLFLLASCLMEDPFDASPQQEPKAQLTVFPIAAPPGAMITIDGLHPGPISTELRIEIGGQATQLQRTAGGRWLSFVPATAAGSNGDAPPKAPVSVRVFDGMVLIGEAADALQIQKLPAAPGAAADFATSLADVAGNLALVLDELHQRGTVEEAYAQAIGEGFEALFDTQSEESMLAPLLAADPAQVELLDRLLASSGMLARTEALASDLAAVFDGGEKEKVWLEDPTTTLDETDLARRLQFEVVAKLFGQQVVNSTAETWANGAALYLGAFGLFGNVPFADTVSALLAMADFVINKIAIGLLPSEVMAFDLVLETDELGYGDTALGTVHVTARNNPPQVGVQDVVGLTLNILGAFNNADPPASVREFLEQGAAYLLGVMQQAVSNYSNAHPELYLDVSGAIVPQMVWQAEVTDPRLVERVTLTPDIVAGDPDVLAWNAAGEAGEGRVYARAAIGPDALLLDLPTGFEYNGGAFGAEIPFSETMTILVRGGLVLEVDLPATMSEGQGAQLDVRAGYENSVGEPIWTEGIQLDFLVDGGELADTGGVTNADGRFTTIAELAPGSPSMIVTVTASDSAGQTLDRSVTALLAGVGPLRIVEARRGCSAAAEVSWYCTNTSVETESDGGQTVDYGPWFGSYEVTNSSGDCQSSASCSHESDLDVDPATGEIHGLSGTVVQLGQRTGRGVAYNNAYADVVFEVTQVPVTLTIALAREAMAGAEFNFCYAAVRGYGPSTFHFNFELEIQEEGTEDTAVGSMVLETPGRYEMKLRVRGHANFDDNDLAGSALGGRYTYSLGIGDTPSP